MTATQSGVVEPADSDDDDVLDVPDTASAVAGAAAQDEQVEDLSQRTETTTVYANPDGSFTRREYASAVRVKNDGRWEDVDLTLEQKPDGSYGPKVPVVPVSVGAGGGKEAARVTLADGQSLAITWPQALPAPTIAGGVATYKISAATDLLIATTGGGVSARIRLNAEPAESDPVFRLGLRAEDVDVQVGDDGALSLTDKDGDEVGGTSKLMAWDADQDAAGDPLNKVPVEADLDPGAQTGDVTRHNLDLSVPDGYLAAPSTTYPVTIDPDIEDLAQVRDNYVRQGDTTDHHNDPNTMIGKQSGNSNTNPAMTYIKFSMSGLEGSTILNADLDMFQYWAGTCSARTYNLHPIADAWIADNLTYTNRPGVLTGTGDTATVTANRGTGCSTGAGTTTANLTNMVKSWVSNDTSSSQGYPNFGARLAVTPDGVDQSSYERRFCSFRPSSSHTYCQYVSREPSLTVTYNKAPLTPAAPIVTFGGNPVTVYTTVRDPNRETQLRARVVVKRGTTTVYDGYTDTVTVLKGADGVEVKERLPYLPDGKYTVTSTAYDETTHSAASPAKSFLVETEFGSQSWYSPTQHGLNDRSGVAVNNRTGNLTVQAGDVKVNGLGVDFNATRFYNSQSTQTTSQGVIPAAELWTTSMGKGWGLSVGPDVWLEKKSATEFDYHAPGGTIFGPFTRKSADPNEFTKPPGGVGADLKQSGTTYTLTFRNSQFRYEFKELGADGDLYQTLSKDRSGNHIDFAYSGTTPSGRAKLATITDTSNRSFAVTYTGDYITSVTNGSGPGTRTWAYGYDTGGYLTSYTDPDSKTTNYAYATSTTGTKLLNSIQNPQGTGGQRTTTTVDYGTETSDAANLDRVKAIHYAKDSGAIDFTWAYGRRNADPTCNSKSDYSTNVTDGRAKTTSYCFNDSKALDEGGDVRVYDAMGHIKSSSFTADKATAQVTSPTNEGASGGSTVASYGGGGISDQLNSVTEPKSEEDAGKTAGTTSFEYNANTAIPGSAYLPSNVTDSNGDCSKYDYDNKGRTTAAYTGLAATSCSPGAGDTGFHRTYNDADGTVATSWDANAGNDNPDTADRTVYTYWATGDAGYVGGTTGQLKTIRKPGGSCDSPRKLCTSYTYDGAARVQTVTDGRGKVTTYTYDSLDRTTGAFFDSATSCAAGNANCVLYTYDGEGNLTTRVDKSGTSTFGYDRLNRQTRQTLADGSVIDLAYDDNGNLTQHKQTLTGQNADVVDYTYDNANRLIKVTDATGDTEISPDSDGRVKQIDFPGSTGVQVDYVFKRSGKPKSATIKSAAGTTLRNYTYSYIKTVNLPAPIGSVDMESGQLQKRTLADAPAGNTETTYGYDQSRLESAHNSNGSLPDYDYTHDKVGNVLSEKIDAATTFYGYDRAGQLCWQDSSSHSGAELNTTCQSVGGATNLDHDAAGNNTGTSTNPRAYNDNSQLTNIGGVAMSYSDLGNNLRTQADTTSFVTSPLGITARKTGTDVTYYTRDSAGNILNAHGAGGTKNYVSEFNGSVTALYNAAGAEVGAYTYSPYGQTTPSGTDAAANPFRYIGGYQDKDTTGDDAYYKLGARYYDTHGHFTQADPIAPGGGSYDYTGGDPINLQDPSGLAPDSLCGAEGSTGYYVPNCGYQGNSSPVNFARTYACGGALFTVASAFYGGYELRTGYSAGKAIFAGGSFSFGLGGIYGCLVG